MAAGKSIDRYQKPLAAEAEAVSAAVAERPGSLASRADVELVMADLVGDDNGEIVFFNDSGFRTLAIQTDSTVVAKGRAEAHVTANGDDVGGFQYVTFDNGLTLYFEDGLELVLSGDTGDSAPSTG